MQWKFSLSPTVDRAGALSCILQLVFAPGARAAGPAETASDATPIPDKWALIIGISNSPCLRLTCDMQQTAGQ